MKDKDIRHLLFTLELTFSDMEPTSVFVELEKRGMFSTSNLKPLAKMMENINRKDLAKELEKFIKKQKPCTQVSKSSRQEASALGQITATLQSIQQVTTLLLNQLEGVKSIVPSDAQYSKVEREITKAIAVVEKNLQPKISLASRSLPPESIDSLDSVSPTPSLSSSCSSQDKSAESIKKRPLPPTPSGLRAREEENDYDVPANSQPAGEDGGQGQELEQYGTLKGDNTGDSGFTEGVLSALNATDHSYTALYRDAREEPHIYAQAVESDS